MRKHERPQSGRTEGAEDWTAQPNPTAPLSSNPASLERLAYRIDELAVALGVSRRLIEREKAAGRLPKPDMQIGRIPLWRPETIRRWIEGGSHR
jgi:hypothetical protein